jgi:tRNA 5-methylaminomethyl-2-thiouridine biosynthesis bifunctional protein
MTGPIEWPDDGPPRSRRFGDLYYSAQDGLAEARQVFLTGCGLPGAWRDHSAFTVAELGFGTGLNIAALIDLWRREGPPDGRLSIFSIEAYPVSAPDAARALSNWPELAPVADILVDRWPGRARGFHRIDLPEFRAALDLAVMDVAEALDAWSGAADAWFLDGFSPACNPEMWRQEVLALLAARSAPGARLATYTAAGEVRRGLAAAGFSVERAPGFGRKRHRLEGRAPGERRPAPPPPRVAIVGAGIAGVSLARAFATQGATAQIYDAGTPSASAGPAALVTPRLDAGLAAPARLFAQAFARARVVYADTPAAIVAEGALQLAVGPKDAGRFAAIAGSDLFEPGEMRVIDAGEASERLAEAAPAALAIAGALVVDPAMLLDVPTTQARISRLAQHDGVWRLFDDAGAQVGESEVVCIAAGMASAALAPGLPLRPVRGQASFAPGVDIATTVLFGGYAAPALGGAVFGATHDRDDEGLEPRAEDHRRNLEAVAAILPALASRLESPALEARVGVRATTSDYLPLAGPAGPPGLFVLTGLGSRGFTLAPLLAEHVAAVALGRPSPLPTPLAELVEPARFARRARRRGQ